jgi:hypothetical protein
MKDSLKNNDCFYFVNKHIQWLYYQLFFFFLCVVFVIFIFLSSLKNSQQRAGHSTSYVYWTVIIDFHDILIHKKMTEAYSVYF